MITHRALECAKIVALAAFVVGFTLWLSVYTTGRYLCCIPLVGALVRFRVNYTPRTAPQLSDEEDAQDGQDGKGCTAYWYPGMAKRMWKLEGWSGVYKGALPAFIPIGVYIFWNSLPFPYYDLMFNWAYDIADILPEKYQFPGYTDLMVTLLYLPYDVALFVLRNRAITTPHHLPFLTPPNRALQSLLSPSEYANPWTIPFSAPIRSIFVSYFAYAVYTTFVLRPLLYLIGQDPALDLPVASITDRPWYAIGRATLLVCTLLAASAVVLTPLDVVCTRLSVLYHDQDHATEAEEGQTSEEGKDCETIGEKASNLSAIPMDGEVCDDPKSKVEPVVAQPDLISEQLPEPLTKPLPLAFKLRREPYAGSMACARLILAEEGPQALWRGWWVTPIVLIWLLR